MVRTFGRRVVAVAAAGLLLGLVAGGCDGGYVNRLNEPVHLPEPIDMVLPGPPAPTSPENLMRGLEWTYDFRGLFVYEHLLTDDFLWRCSPNDTAGAAFRTPWTRSDELAFAKNLFLGGGPDQPAAVGMALTLAPSLEVLPDPDFATWDPLGRWHKRIRTPVELKATLADQSSIEILAFAVFSVVRGDSAMIPEGLSRGTLPDSSRWFIRRWEEESATPIPAGAARGTPLRAQPSSALTWCALKERYR